MGAYVAQSNAEREFNTGFALSNLFLCFVMNKSSRYEHADTWALDFDYRWSPMLVPKNAERGVKWGGGLGGREISLAARTLICDK